MGEGEGPVAQEGAVGREGRGERGLDGWGSAVGSACRLFVNDFAPETAFPKDSLKQIEATCVFQGQTDKGAVSAPSVVPSRFKTRDSRLLALLADAVCNVIVQTFRIPNCQLHFRSHQFREGVLGIKGFVVSLHTNPLSTSLPIQ